MTILNAPKHCGTAQQVHQLIQGFALLAAHLPSHSLYPPERRELGGLILPLTPALVLAVSEALADQPALFPGAPVSGPALAERQRCANHWLILRNFLKTLTEQANDNYLLTQAQAASDAAAVLARAGQAPPEDPLRTRRHAALVSAYFLVHEYQQAIQKKKAHNRAARAAERGAAPSKARAPRAAARAVLRRRWEQLMLAAFAEAFPRRPPQPPVTPPPGPGNFYTPGSAPSRILNDEAVAKGSTAAYTSSCMSKEQELVELFERAHGPLNPARPEDSFLHSEADLEKGREQARVAADAFPEFKLAADVARDFAADRYPEMGGVVELLRMGVEEHPGLIPGPVGDPALWTQVGALDRASGRLIYAGQLIQGGGEAGALTVGAAANGLCEGAAQRAADLIAAPGTADNVRSLVRSAFCEPFRLLTDQRDREAQQQKVKDEGTRPLQDQIDKTAERAALTRAIEAFLSTQGAGS